MGFSHKSHDKKSDKETQSPMFRIFEEIIQKEQKDTGKANLLKEKQEKHKKHRSRSKSDRKADSSSVDRSKQKQKKKMAEDQGNWAYNENGTQSMHYQSGKRDSWWLWNAADKKTDDSCSCATCPLKKLIGSDFACVGCLVILFVVSVMITSFVVYKTMPLHLGRADAELEQRQVTEMVESTPRDMWNADLSNRFGSYAGLFGSGYGDSSFRDSNMMDDEGKVSRELESVIGSDKLYDVQGSDKLREFYKKLIQTDAQLKKLKQSFESNNVMNQEFSYNMNVPERYRRSLKFIKPKRHLKYNSRHKLNKRFDVNEGLNSNRVNKVKRTKRNDDQPEGYVIEKKKVLIQYKPLGSKRQFSKCFHTPKDSKSHEDHLKHPFYQNSQRLDELLDNILDRNIPDIVQDPLTLDLLFSHKAKCSHKSESKSNNLDFYNSVPSSAESFTMDKELKSSEETSTHKTTNPNLSHEFKEMTVFTPLIHAFIQNITLFNKAIEGHDYEKLNLDTTESNHDKNKFGTDPSSNFMAKIHGKNHLQTSKTNLGSNYVNKIKAPDKYDHFKSLYNQDINLKSVPSRADNDKNAVEDRNSHFNFKGLPQDNLIEMVLDDTRTIKTFDMNLDYNDFLSSTNINEEYTTNSIIQEKEQDGNRQRDATDWRSNGHRKLLQIEEEDDDTLGYEDLKEVLADEMEAHDETDRRVDRKKRNNYFPDVYNRNWKGPIPLYPDEVNAMIKQAAIENVRIPVNTKEIREIDKKSNEISDTDYIEDYFNNKYDKLVNLAQAYSDYGVLGGKKEGLNLNTNKPTVGNDVARNRLDISKNFISGIEARTKKESAMPSEGIRFEIKPGKGTSIAKDQDFMGSFQKHFKFIKGNKSPEPKTTGIPFVHPVFSSLPNLSTLHYSFDKPYKHDSNSIEETILAPKRTLKSIEYLNMDAVDSDEARDVNNTIMNKNDKSLGGKDVSIRNTTNESLKDEHKGLKNNSNVNATTQVSDFFTMMSDWFRMLSKLSGETNITGQINSSTISRNDVKENKSLDVSYPLYDSDMIENIGHRSRVLMSMEDTNVSLTAVDSKSKEDYKSYNTDKRLQSTVQSNSDRVSSTLMTTQVTENVTLKDNKSEQIHQKDATNIENKTISKRSVETDSKLNFWNDMYDDEYGVKLNYFDKSTRNKHSVKSGDLMKKSKHWFEGKVKNLANKLRSTKSSKKDAVTENILTESAATKIIPTSKPKIRKRRIRNLFRADAEDPNDFAALTANMKKVVREAANAVRETRKLTVREDNKEETMASSLMQQLVRLMADVVDFQVQQKTCAKLPADLQKFLEWLTSASDKQEQLSDIPPRPEISNNIGYGNALSYEKKEADDTGLMMPEDHQEERTQCLGSIQAIQELMKQYEEMNDEDKSKMTGVKQYLEDQLNFLNKRVSAMDEFNINKYYKKRETPNHDLKKRKTRFKRGFKRRLNKFIKNYGKKHTKTTAGNIDAVTEAKNAKKN